MQKTLPTPSAYFKLINVFTITGRGDALAGNILAGNINTGDRIELNINGTVVKLDILSVEAIDSPNDKPTTGLIVGKVSNDVLETVKLFLGQVIVVVSGD